MVLTAKMKRVAFPHGLGGNGCDGLEVRIDAQVDDADAIVRDLIEIDGIVTRAVRIGDDDIGGAQKMRQHQLQKTPVELGMRGRKFERRQIV